MLNYLEYPAELLNPIWLLILVMTLGISVFTDLKSRKIPNMVSFGGLGLMLIYLSLNLPFEDLKLHGLSLLVGAAIFVPLFAMRGLGGGDVKLLLMVCLSFSVEYLFSVLLWITLTGGVQGLASLLIYKRKALPYAIAIAGGTGLYLVTSWYF